jgi:hypothetical protein
MKAVKELVMTTQVTWARHDFNYRSTIDTIGDGTQYLLVLVNIPHTIHGSSLTLKWKRHRVVAG